jgi:hypothetical protein
MGPIRITELEMCRSIYFLAGGRAVDHVVAFGAWMLLRCLQGLLALAADLRCGPWRRHNTKEG